MTQPSQSDIDALQADRLDPEAWDNHEVAATVATPISDVLVGWVIDRSSSMLAGNQHHAAVTGFNAFLAEQRALEGTCRTSALLFSSCNDWKVIPAGGGPLAVEDHVDLSLEAFNVGGNTALYDAVVIAIEALERWVKAQAYDGAVKVIIFTDGQENDSRYSTLQSVNDAVGRKQAEGWEFVFLGSGGAAWLEGRSMSNMAASTYSVGVGEQNVVDSFATVSSSVSGARRSGVSMASGMNERYGDPNAQRVRPPVDPAAATAASLRDRLQAARPIFAPPAPTQSRPGVVGDMAGQTDTPVPGESSREKALRRMAGSD